MFAKGEEGEDDCDYGDKVDAGADFYSADDVAGFVPGGEAEAGSYQTQEEEIYPVQGI